MGQNLPRSITSALQFDNGSAIGISNRWINGQYCSIPAEFNQALAVAQGTPEVPLVDPEDLLDAEIVRCTPRAESMGICPGMSGREAVELMLLASREESVE